MSARGFLYVTEDIRDIYKKKLDKIFGKNKWELNGNDYNDLWVEEEYPEFMQIPVEDNITGEKIGTIEVENRHFVDDWGNGKFIEVEPKSLFLLEKMVKGKMRKYKRRKNG